MDVVLSITVLLFEEAIIPIIIAEVALWSFEGLINDVVLDRLLCFNNCTCGVLSVAPFDSLGNICVHNVIHSLV